ncbi:hypothetical protein CSOJ01_15660 [Colletotrichum sojae]|uniref:Uncharacterized protein n=1 Tax=Colletotrichum sojae TaxID=2175907 RepID=A0A8H6MIN4_9PEZI|nr:hypothetical protein CSOJ01_15660 [Colletotrichum sojae]
MLKDVDFSTKSTECLKMRKADVNISWLSILAKNDLGGKRVTIVQKVLSIVRGSPALQEVILLVQSTLQFVSRREGDAVCITPLSLPPDGEGIASFTHSDRGSCGNEGVNLNGPCRHVAILEPTPSLAVEDQTVARVHRVTTKETITIRRLISKNTFDECVVTRQYLKRLEDLEARFNPEEADALVHTWKFLHPEIDLDDSQPFTKAVVAPRQPSPMAARDFMSLQTYQSAKASYNQLSAEEKILFSPERSLVRGVHVLSCIAPTTKLIRGNQAARQYSLECLISIRTGYRRNPMRFSPQTDYSDVSPRFLMDAIRSLQVILPGGKEGASDAVETAIEILLGFLRKEPVGEDDGDVSSEEDRVGDSELEDMLPSATSPRLLQSVSLGPNRRQRGSARAIPERGLDPSQPPPAISKDWVILDTSEWGLYCFLWATIGNMKEQYSLGLWPTIQEFREVRRSKEVVEEWTNHDEDTARTWRDCTHDQAARLLLHWGARQTPPLLCRLRPLGGASSNNIIHRETHKAFDTYSEQDGIFKQEDKGPKETRDVFIFHDFERVHFHALRPRR